MCGLLDIGELDRPMRVEQTENSALENDKVRIITVHDLTALRLHQCAWERLARESPQALPMQLPTWILAGITSGTWHKETWFCSLAYIGDRVVGVLPVIVSPHPIFGRRWPVLRSFDILSQSGDILLASDYAPMALRALLAELRQQVPSHLSLHLKAVRHNSLFWEAARNGLDGYSLRQMGTCQYSRLDVSGDHNSYLASLGKMRRDMKRYLKKLRSLGEVSVEIARGPSAKADFLADFLALEASGWKGRNQSAIANRPNEVSFYKALISNFAVREDLEWYAMRINGHLVSALMCLRCGSTLIVPKVAYDEEFSKCMPGHLLFAELIKEAFGRTDIHEFNFLSNAIWLNSWRVDYDTYVDVDLVARGTWPILTHRLWSIYMRHVRPRIPTKLKAELRRIVR
jgi:CelD/BcsL family acetyltransferase involved in cellulose biosynthesis